MPLHSLRLGAGAAALALGLLASAVSGTKPVWATEVGFHNALLATAGQVPASERAAAVSTLRAFLEHFKAGVVRTFAYELLDEQPEPGITAPEQHFGLLCNDFTEKPAFRALANLITVLRPQAGWGGTLRAVDLDTGTDPQVSRLVLQRGDGPTPSSSGARPASGTGSPGGT